MPLSFPALKAVKMKEAFKHFTILLEKRINLKSIKYTGSLNY